VAFNVDLPQVVAEILHRGDVAVFRTGGFERLKNLYECLQSFMTGLPVSIGAI